MVFIPGLLRKRPPYRWMLTNRRLSDFFYLSPGICTPDAPDRYRSSFAFFLFSYPRRPATLRYRCEKTGIACFFFFPFFPSFLFFCSCCSFGEVCLVIICNRNSFLFLRFDILISNRNLFNLITIYRNRVCHNFLLIILKYL